MFSLFSKPVWPHRVLACSLVCLIFFAASTAHGAAPSDGVCVENPFIALNRFFRIRKEEEERLVTARGLSAPRDIIVKENLGDYFTHSLDSAVLAFEISEGYICSFLFSRTHNFRYFRQPYVDGQLESLIKELSISLNVESTSNNRAARLRNSNSAPAISSEKGAPSASASIQAISQILFPEVLRHDLAPVRELTIVPVRGISAIPVAMLEPLGDGRKTVDLFSVYFVASITDLRKHEFQRSQHTFRQPVIIGNPRPSLDRDYIFPELPGAEQEAKNVQDQFGGTLLLATDATKANVVQALNNADLIYFASHGFADSQNAVDKSFLMLSDGRLSAREIQSFHFSHNPLVVLSACQTGEGAIAQAGIIGLARAFQIAGATNTVMSLWVISDEATQKLMHKFAENIKTKPVAEALRLSMLELRKSDPDPAHWASFNVFGVHDAPSP